MKTERKRLMNCALTVSGKTKMEQRRATTEWKAIGMTTADPVYFIVNKELFCETVGHT